MLVAVQRVVGVGAIVIGLLMALATYRGRPRARRPELAPILYVQSALVGVVGLVMFIASFLPHG